MNKLVYLNIILLGFTACGTEPETTDLIKSLTASQQTISADGQSVVEVTADLNDKLDEREVIFTTTNGRFEGGENGELKMNAIKIDNDLKAVAKLVAPSSPEIITIRAEVNIDDKKGLFTQSIELQSIRSVPSSIELKASDFSVQNDFGGEVTLIGDLKNNEGKNVSTGVEVTFAAYDSTLTMLDGHFRDLNHSSNSSSQVSAIYSPGLIASDQYILLTATISEDLSISDTIRLYVKQNDN